MTPAQRRTETERLSDQTCKAAAARDKAVERLKLDRDVQADDFDARLRSGALDVPIGSQADDAADSIADGQKGKSDEAS